MNRKNIYLMYAIVLLQGMVFYGPIATLYRQASGVSIFQITLIESISYILCILFELPWGKRCVFAAVCILFQSWSFGGQMGLQVFYWNGYYLVL